jgi:hypothetical protein
MKKQDESDRISSGELHAALGLRTRAATAYWRSAGYLPAVHQAGAQSFYLISEVLAVLEANLDEWARQTYRDLKAFLKLRKQLEKETNERAA